LSFPFLHSYSGQSAITDPVTLSSGASAYVDLLAKLDAGSTYCVFDRAYAALLGLDLHSGVSQRIRTATGAFQTYGHEVTLAVFDFEWQAVVYFAENETFPSTSWAASASWTDFASGWWITTNSFISICMDGCSVGRHPAPVF